MNLDLLAQVQAVLDGLGVSSALIGAGAMAHAGHPRSTEDLDLLVLDASVLQLPVWQPLSGRYDVEVNASGLHDDRDPLAGVVRVRHHEAADQVDVVVGKDPKWQQPILDRAVPAGFVAAPTVKVALPEDLVLLKLYAGGRQSENDILALLEVVDGLEAAVEARSAEMPRALRTAWQRLRKLRSPPPARARR